MNSLHPTIKFTFEYSREKIAFLDTMVYIDGNRYHQTTIFRKPTDRMCLLHFSSNHPIHVKRSIVYTQALRYCTIISEDSNLESELQVLTRTLLARDYPLGIVIEGLRKSLSHTRPSLLLQKEKLASQNITPLVIEYNSVGTEIRQVVSQHWNTITEDPGLARIWRTPPITAYTRANNLRDTLVHSRQRYL